MLAYTISRVPRRTALGQITDKKIHERIQDFVALHVSSLTPCPQNWAVKEFLLDFYAADRAHVALLLAQEIGCRDVIMLGLDYARDPEPEPVPVFVPEPAPVPASASVRAPSSSSQGLSPNAKIAIGVGVVSGISLTFGIVLGSMLGHTFNQQSRRVAI